jgi:non-heme chloroperoxidase
VPVLAFFTFPPSVDDQLRRFQVKGDQERKAVEDVYAADLYWINRRIQDLQRGVPRARVIKLPGANHYIFLSNEADVLPELHAFVAGLNS